jgi:acyl-CoA oxidase
MKFWIGNAAQTANMAIVFANLIVKGKDYGIHPFIVEIRDSNSHNVLPGITIGDCGDKFGLKGVDNGFLIFRNVRTPRTNLLDRIT